MRGILFDFGGTLDGPGLSWTDRFGAAYRRAGLELAAERIEAAAGYSTRSAYADPALPKASLRETVAFHVGCQLRFLEIEDPALGRSIAEDFAAETEASLAESRRLLGALAGRFALGVVSNFYGNLERVLAEAGLLELLDAAIDSAVVGVAKPDPEIFRLSTECLRVAAPEVLFVGDSLDKDVLPARAYGMRSAWLAPPERRADLPPDVARLTALDEVERLVAA